MTQLFSYSGLPREKRRLHRIYQLHQSCAAKNTAFTTIRKTVQTRPRKVQDSWLAAKAEEIQKYADTHDSKRFYDALRLRKQSTDRNHRARFIAQCGWDNTYHCKPAILNRWAEHFSAVLNRPAYINADATR